jgi:hypothetical protein
MSLQNLTALQEYNCDLTSRYGESATTGACFTLCALVVPAPLLGISVYQ